MDNQATTPEGTEAHAATTADIFKELVLEFIDPVKNYGYLYLLTIVSLLNNARGVVASIIMPPTEPAHNREDLRTQLSKAIAWLKSPWAHQNNSVEQAFTAKPGRKYYNPISFLALTIGLKIFISSIFSLKEPPSYEKYCEASAFTERALVEKWKQGVLTKNEFAEALEALAASDAEQVSRLKRIEQIVAVDYFKKVLPLFAIVAICLLYAVLLHKIFTGFATIELFIIGVYINTLLLIVMYWLNSVVSFMGKDFWLLSDAIYYTLLGLCPGFFYIKYIAANKNSGSAWKKLSLLPIYSLCFALMTFIFTGLVDFIAYLYIGA